MSFATSLSGLTSAATAIDIIGNNVSNLQTVGFKTSKARFADVLAAAQPGAPTASMPSAGVATTVIRQTDQGVLAESSDPLDMAIVGLGFFRLSQDDEITYSRDGRFQISFDSTAPNMRSLVNNEGRAVTGYLADYATDPEGSIDTTGTPQEIAFEATMPAAATGKVSINANLDARIAAPAASPFDPNNTLTFNTTTATTVYDATGGAHDFRLYLARPSSENLWDVYTTLDGGSATGPLSLGFDSRGVLATAMPMAAQTYALSGGGSLPMSLDFSGTTQYGNSFSVQSIAQDGWAEGTIDSLSGFEVGNDGIIEATYSNGKSRRVAQVVLANFVNPDAMIGIGDSQWIANADPVKGSGKEILDVPGRGGSGIGMGAIQGGANEQSNVDLNTELVALIEQQRNYQASAQTFKILDQVLQNLANIGK